MDVERNRIRRKKSTIQIKYHAFVQPHMLFLKQVYINSAVSCFCLSIAPVITFIRNKVGETDPLSLPFPMLTD